MQPNLTAEANTFNRFFQQHRKWLMVVAVSLLQDEATAKRVLQQFFTDCWKKKLYKRTDSTLKSSLYQAVRQECMKELKKEGV